MTVTVTEDHSLFNDKQEKIKPSEINEKTKLEYYGHKIESSYEYGWLNEKRALRMAKWLKDGTLNQVPTPLLNTKKINCIKVFLGGLQGFDFNNATKTCRAGILFLKEKLKNK